MQTRCRLSIERIEQAARVIDAVFLRTPQFVCEPLSDLLGVRLALKIETLNPIRTFKGEMFRGRLVGTIVTGGNLTPDQMRQWL